MPSTCQLYLIRHAESAPCLATPNPQWSLSPRGVQQADKLASLLQTLPIAAVYSSPFTRSVQTVTPFATAAGLPIVLNEGLRESSLVTAYRRDFSAIERKAWAYQSFALPGCESARAARERLHTALRGIAANHPNQSVVVGTHGIVLGFFLHGLDARFRYEQAKAIKNPDLFHLEWDQTAFVWQKDNCLRQELFEFATHR